MTLLLLGSVSIVANCGGESQQESSQVSARSIQIVTTTGMIADLASNIGGDRVDVTALMGAGVDPHLYKASEGDMRRMTGADIIFYNGLHLEGAMAEVLEQIGARRRTVAVTDRISRDRLLAPPEFKGQHDPHVWFDVAIWMDAAQYVHEAMLDIDPDHAAVYDSNFAAYSDSLSALHEYVKATAERLEPEQRILITAHDAFNYFGRAYGFEVRGLQGISTATEAGTADVKGLAEFIATQRIPAMFVESSVSPRSIEAVQAAVRARGFDVAIGGELFSDAMGRAGTPEGTYLGMVRHNIDTIVEALLGKRQASTETEQ
jgi:manganese/zinc/iron transport system substrate-binding protein